MSSRWATEAPGTSQEPARPGSRATAKADRVAPAGESGLHGIREGRSRAITPAVGVYGQRPLTAHNHHLFSTNPSPELWPGEFMDWEVVKGARHPNKIKIDAMRYRGEEVWYVLLTAEVRPGFQDVADQLGRLITDDSAQDS
jgi:hypothetical protein